jgi:hypothetical protein
MAEAEGELHRFRSAQHDVGLLLQNVASQSNRILEQRRLHDATGPAAAIHQAGVHARYSIGLKVGACSGIQQRLIFEAANCRFDGIQGAATGLQNFPTGFSGAFASGVSGRVFLFWNRTASSVDHQGGFRLFAFHEIRKIIGGESQFGLRTSIFCRAAGFEIEKDYCMPIRLADNLPIPGSATVSVAPVGVSPTVVFPTNRIGMDY